MSTQHELEPFRFMDLPAELRFMVYERLPRQIKHTEVDYTGFSPFQYGKKVSSTVTLITRHITVAILRTSRQIYAEAHGIVADLVRKFVKELQPRVIEHDIAGGLDALGVLMQFVMNGRQTLSNGQPYHMISVCRRNPHFTDYPWRTERSSDVARFLCQAALATKADTDTHHNTIATIPVCTFDQMVDQTLLVLEFARTRTRINRAIRSGQIYGHALDTYIQIDEGWTLLTSPTGFVELTPENVPLSANMEVVHAHGKYMFETWMSKETWVREWLPSS